MTYTATHSFDVNSKGNRPRTPVGIWSWNSIGGYYTFSFPTWYGVATNAEKELIGSWSLDPSSNVNQFVIKKVGTNNVLTFVRA